MWCSSERPKNSFIRVYWYFLCSSAICTREHTSTGRYHPPRIDLPSPSPTVLRKSRTDGSSVTLLGVVVVVSVVVVEQQEFGKRFRGSLRCTIDHSSVRSTVRTLEYETRCGLYAVANSVLQRDRQTGRQPDRQTDRAPGCDASRAQHS